MLTSRRGYRTPCILSSRLRRLALARTRALVWNAFASAVNCKLETEVKVVHRFSCERNRHKQGFIRGMFDVPLMYEDATKLGEPALYDAVSGSEQQSPQDINFFAVGWPCTDASSLNKHSSSLANRTCVSSSSLRTGSVFKRVVNFVRPRA